MVGVIFDSSALIICNKPPPVSDVILEINKLLYSDIIQRVTVYLTSDILKEYETVVAPRAGKCGKYPELAGSINRLLELRRIVQKSRGFICKPRGLRPVFHVLESTVVERYEVDIPEDETDRKFIKAALAVARLEDVVYLITYDSGLLEVDLGKLRERYQEAEKVKIVDPKEAVERLKSASSR
jgi:predicted nucleic acid-binding protein